MLTASVDNPNPLLWRYTTISCALGTTFSDAWLKPLAVGVRRDA